MNLIYNLIECLCGKRNHSGTQWHGSWRDCPGLLQLNPDSIGLTQSEAHISSSIYIGATGFGKFLLEILKSVQYKRITSSPLHISCQVLDKMCSTNVDMES